MRQRSFYLDDFSDEVMPCEPSLEGWFAWLTAAPEIDEDGNNQWGTTRPMAGDGFVGTAIRWLPDVLATRSGGAWTLSRDPGDVDFAAVRFGEGMGWTVEQIVTVGCDDQLGLIDNDTAAQAILRWLQANDDDCDDQEFIAVGEYESGWRFTLKTDCLIAERTQ